MRRVTRRAPPSRSNVRTCCEERERDEGEDDDVREGGND